jgi:hypothetical protein
MGSDQAVELNGSGKPSKVLIIGGSYGALAATLNLLDLCHGRAPRFPPETSPGPSALQKIRVQITIVDERDGFCANT